MSSEITLSKKRIGGLIVAAGKSCDADPMDVLGEMTVVQRIISAMSAGGVDIIAVVTGYNAEVLERHLAHSNVVCIRNKDYASTGMFDSVKIGLSFFKGKVEGVVVTPMDVPLFTAGTVRKIAESDADIAVPTNDGETGHPVFISGKHLEKILMYEGNEGLKGAICSCDVPVAHIEVSDRAIKGYSSSEDNAELIERHSDSLTGPRLRVAIAREKVFFDEETAILIGLIDEKGSVMEACKSMQMSYSTGWNRIKVLESQLKKPLIERKQGGSRDSRSSITPYGRALLDSYSVYHEKMRRISEELFASELEQYFR